MNDIDFDELDRAVNSLVGSGSGQKPIATDEPKEKVLSINTTPSRPTISNQPTINAAPTLIEKRSSGQFMDVVHPSSNMRSLPLVMPSRLSRQGTTVAQASVNMAPMRPDVSSITTPAVHNVAINPINPIIVPTDESIDSPFIPDAKVEKRPLGAFSAEPTAVDTATLGAKEPVAVEKKELSQALPAELQSDLLLIESGDVTAEDAEVAKPDMKPIEPSPVQPIAPTSITQQYAEKPNTGDQNNGSIYDTDTYHKTMIVPAKKKSSWMWVMWISILLIVGAGAGAAIYLFVLK